MRSQRLASNACFAIPAPLNRSLPHYISPPSTKRIRYNYVFACRGRPPDSQKSNTIAAQSSPKSIDTRSPHQPGNSGIDLIKLDFARVQAFFAHLITRPESLFPSKWRPSSDFCEESAKEIANSSSDPGHEALIPQSKVELKSHPSTSAYEPRSAAGQVVAQRFSEMRGAFGRAVAIARLRVADTLRVAVVVTATVTTAIGTAATRFLVPAKNPRGWQLLPSFQWQISDDGKSDSRRTLVRRRRARVESLRRAMQSRNVTRQTVSTLSSFSRMADVVVPAAWRRMAALPMGRGGGTISVAGAGAAAVAVSVGPVATMVSCTAIVLASVAVIGARAGVTDESKQKKLGNISLSGPSSASMQAMFSSVNQRLAQSQAQKLWRQRHVMRRGPAYVERDSTYLTDTSKYATAGNQTRGLEKTQMTRDMGDKNFEKVKSIETSAYTVSESRPWLLSLPVIGMLLSLLDIVAFGVEEVAGRVLQRMGVKIERNSDGNDGWLLLTSLNEIKAREI